MVSDNAWDLYYAQNDKDKCTNCQRVLPNKKMRTKNGCVWCDDQHYKEKK